MFLVIYFSRAKSPEDAQAVCALYSHDLSLRMKPGYIRGECAIKVDDPCAIVVTQFWGTEAARDAAQASVYARQTVAAYAAHLVAPSEVTVYEVY